MAAPDGSPAIPAGLDQLTMAHVTAALRAGGVTATPIAIDLEPLGPGAGFLGDVARVVLHYDTEAPAVDDRPATVMVKTPPADPAGRAVGAMLGVWGREHAFYTEIAPASPGAQVPRCYHTAADPGADGGEGRWLLVLEDCRSEPLDPAVGATRAQAEAAIDALAAFHAHWWEAEHRYGWMPGFDGPGVGGLQGAWLDAIPLFITRYGHLLPGPTADWLPAFAVQLPLWSQRAGGEAMTIVHADYRLDNLRYHQGRMTIIDWQTALRGPGAMDLSSFVATALTIDDRRQWEPDLIQRYRRALADGGVDVNDGWLQRSYDENLLWWMGQFANNLARLEPDDPAAQLVLDTMIERTYTAANDRDVGRLLN